MKQNVINQLYARYYSHRYPVQDFYWCFSTAGLGLDCMFGKAHAKVLAGLVEVQSYLIGPVY